MAHRKFFLRVSFHVYGAILLFALAASFGCAAENKSNSSATYNYKTMNPAPRRDSSVADAQNAKAVDFLEEGKLEEAEKLLKDCLTADVTFGPAHNNLGKVYFQQQKYYVAAWEFQNAIKLMPNQPEPKNNLGLVFEAVGKLDDAVKQYELAKGQEPDNPELTGNLARARVRRGDHDEQTRDLLTEITLKDTREEWVEWAKEQLALMGGPSRRSFPEFNQTQPINQ